MLALAIMALLISGLLIAGGNFLDRERDRVARDQLDVLGERTAGGIENVDRMAGASNGSSVVVVRVPLPPQTAGSRYRITINNTTGGMAADRPYSYDIVFTTTSPETNIEHRVPIRTHHRMIERTVLGGDIVVSYYDENGDGQHELVLDTEIPVENAGGGG